ncbi:hypothetical protein Tco_0210879 [Tanacetum coccineum]
MDPNSSPGKNCLGEDVVVISSDKVEGSGDWNSPEFQDTANSRKKKETKGMVFYQIETEEVSDRFVALCFVNGLEAYDREINLGVEENMISNEYALKLCLEHEVKKGNKVIKKELIVALRGKIYFVKFIINPEEDDVEPGVIFETEEEEKSNDDWDHLLDFNIDDVPLLGEEGLLPFICKIGEEPIIETVAYHDKYKKILDEVWKDKVELDGNIVKEEEDAVKRIKGEALKEKDDPGAFIFPIRLEGQVNENALANTGWVYNNEILAMIDLKFHGLQVVIRACVLKTLNLEGILSRDDSFSNRKDGSGNSTQTHDYAMMPILQTAAKQTINDDGTSIYTSSQSVTTERKYKDAKTLFAAIQTRFGGNEATKKTQKTLLKQMYENFSAPRTESLDSILTGFQKVRVFQQPKFEGYGPKSSKSVSEDISNEVRESPDAPLVEELVSAWSSAKRTSRPDIMFSVCACTRFQVKIDDGNAFWNGKYEVNVIQALVDGKKVIVTETSVRRVLQLKDAEAPEELGEGSEIPTDPQHTPTIIQPSTSQPQKKQPRRKQRKDTEVPQPSGSTEPITDEVANEAACDPTYDSMINFTVLAYTTTVDEVDLRLRPYRTQSRLINPKAVYNCFLQQTTTTVIRPKPRGVVVQEPSEFRTTTSSSKTSQLPQAKDTKRRQDDIRNMRLAFEKERSNFD